MSNFYLLKFVHDYADEFDVYGICLCDQKQYSKIIDCARKASYPCERYFGTNESFEWSDFEDWEDGIKVTKLSWHDYSVMCNAFGFPPLKGGDWGVFIVPGE